MIKILTSIVYVAFLVLGIRAAYRGDMAVALFFAILCASENIAISMDYWPRLQKKSVKAKHE